MHTIQIFLLSSLITFSMFAGSQHTPEFTERALAQPRNPWENYKVCLAREMAKEIKEQKVFEKLIKVKESFLKAVTDKDKEKFESLYDTNKAIAMAESRDYQFANLYQSDPEQKKNYQIRLAGYQAAKSENYVQFTELINNITARSLKVPISVDGTKYSMGWHFWNHDDKTEIVFEVVPQEKEKKLEIEATQGLCGNTVYPNGKNVETELPNMNWAVAWEFSLGGRSNPTFRVMDNGGNGWAGASGFSSILNSALSNVFSKDFDYKFITKETDKSIDKLMESELKNLKK